MLYSTVKRWLPAAEIDNRNISQKSSVFLTQMERRNRVQSESQSQIQVFNFTNMNSKVFFMKYFIVPINFCNSTFDLALFIQKEVCQQYARDGVAGGIGSRDPTSFEGRSPLYSQQIRREAFLIASLPPTILCYNHKVSKNPLPPPSFNLQKHLALAIIRKQVIYFL